MTLRRWGTFAAASLALTACNDCGKDDYVPFREVPFCANDAPTAKPQLAKSYVVAMKYDDGYHVHDLQLQGRTRLIAIHEELVLGVVECGGPILTGSRLETEMAKMTATHMPDICRGMTVLHQEALTAQEDGRSKGLGQTGYYVFPKIALACKDGTMVRREPYTLSEHLATLQESVTWYRYGHEGALPPDMAALTLATKTPPLPNDPWGTPMNVTFSRGVLITSAGPDKKPGTADDQEVLSKRGTSWTSITTFKGANYAMYGDYDAFVKAPTLPKPATPGGSP